MKYNQNVCAVVVTYNRKELLLECLDALISQSRKLNAIYIIDNFSNDGTEELLYQNNYINEKTPNTLNYPGETEHTTENIKIHYVKMNENTGGAGGFYEGVKRGYENGYDWLWLMDDDAEPNTDALDRLMKFLVDHQDENIVMVAPKNIGLSGQIQKLHRGYFDPNLFNQQFLTNEEYIKNFVNIDFASFVGPLFSRNVIEKIGFPNKEFFIWFDDTEYSLRAGREGKMYLVNGSIIVHKDNSENVQKSYLPIEQYWKSYYGTRNRIFLLRHYTNLSIYTLLYELCIKKIRHILFRLPNKFIRIKYTIKACKDGFFNQLGKRINPEEFRSKYSNSN